MAIFIAALAFFAALGALMYGSTSAKKVDDGLAQFGNALRRDLGATRNEINSKIAAISQRLELLSAKLNRIEETGGKAFEEIATAKTEIATLRSDLTYLSDCIPPRLRQSVPRPQQDHAAN